jgi:hypothetical protein
MPFNAGEHVGVTDRQGRVTYGQVVKRTGTTYTIRLGGSDSTFEAQEADIRAIIPGRTVGTAAYPPPSYLKGTITLPTLAYPFSNEKGFKDGTFWEILRRGGIARGAVIGVSGSVFDIATGDLEACTQIISVDINRSTVEAIDQLRKLLNCLGAAGAITRKKTHFRTQAVTRTPLNRCQFLKECVGIFRLSNVTITEFLNEVEFAVQGAKEKVTPVLLDLEKICKGALNYSCWFEDEAAIQRISSLLSQGRVSILCGDMITPEMLAEINRCLDFPVSIFNMSNAIDYITDARALVRLFSGMRAAAGAKVVTSSQRDELSDLAGTFAQPKVHSWQEFLALLSNPGFTSNIGKLASGM